MAEMKDIPDHLRTTARTLTKGSLFAGMIHPGHDSIMGISEGIPIKEVKIHNNTAVLNPGESALSGNFALCSAVIAKKGDQLFVMHIYPGESSSTEYIDSVVKQGIIHPQQDDLFDEVLLIGRSASQHIENFARVSHHYPQTISVARETQSRYFDQEREKLFSLLVYNNPDKPGDVSSFDLWFDEQAVRE